MKFGEKLRLQRQEKGLSQVELAKELGVTTRTLINYEGGTSHPKSREIYYKLSEFFDVDINYFLTEDAEFLTLAAQRYGSKGMTEAKEVLEQATALFAGGKLSDEDKLAFLHEMQAIYFDSKERARTKFTSKKLRKPANLPEN